MSAKKVLVILLAVVLVAVVCGTLILVYRNAPGKLLQKSDVALHAGKIEDALKYAEQYIADDPNDWLGYDRKARAQIAGGQYEASRKTIDQAVTLAKKDAKAAALNILMAQSYSQEARKALDSFSQDPNRALTPKRLGELTESIAKYDKGESCLTSLPIQTLEITNELGNRRIEHAQKRHWLARQLEEDAYRAKAQRDEKTAAKRLEQSKQARERAKTLLAEATADLLKVVQQDGKQKEAATRLVELCLDRQDNKTLALAREAIRKMENPPPVAAMMLEMHEMEKSVSLDTPVDRPRIQKSIEVLNDLLARFADLEKLSDRDKAEYTYIKYTKAELTQRLGDADTTRKLCEEIIKIDNRNPRARLMLARLQLQAGEIQAAETQLLSLTKEIPDWAEAQYSYAMVAIQVGKKNAAMDALKNMAKLPPAVENKLRQAELALVLSDLQLAQRLVEDVLYTQPGNGWARLLQGNILQARGLLDQAERVFSQLAQERQNWPQVQLALAQVANLTGHGEVAIKAAREAVRLDPKNAQAQKLLTTLLLKESQFDKSFETAKKSVQDHPDDPTAIKLYVEAAERNNHVDLALAMLDKCMKDYSKRPEVMLAVAEGFANLNKRDKAVEAANLARQGEMPTAVARLSVVRALMLLDRMPEAEKMLAEELRKEPDRSDLRFQMGQICASTGRMLPAIDQLRKALELDPNNIGYRISLARAQLDSGDLGEANETLSRVDPSNPTAKVLRLQIQLMSGQKHVDVEQMFSSIQGNDRANIALTLPYLSREQLQQCVEHCRSELKKTPDDIDLHLLLGRAHLAMGNQNEGVQQWEFVLAKAPDRLSTYLEIASILARDSSLDQVLARMSRIPGARMDMINLAIGRMVAATGDYEKAAEILGKVANRPEAPEHVRGRAILLLGQTLAMADEPEKAAAQFKSLFTSQTWRKEAMFSMAQLLGAMKKIDEFKTLLSDLRKIAQADKDTSQLRNVAELYANRQQYDLALQVCDELMELSPEDARNFRLRAAVLNLAKSFDESIACFDKAIEKQPQNFSLYLAQMQIYNQQQKSLEALAVLRKLEKNGAAASVIAMFQRGQLFASWGLLDQAAECYGKLSNLGYNGNPQVKLALGQAYAMLGRRTEATEYLQGIPSFADEYVTARQMLARIAPDAQTALATVAQLRETYPLNENVLMQQMEILTAIGQPAEAVKSFNAYIAQPRVKRLPEEVSFAAMQLMIETGQVDAARQLTQRAVQDHLQPRWRFYQALLMLDKDPAAAIKTLPSPEKSDIHSVLVQFYAACKRSDAAARDKWAAQASDMLQKGGAKFVAPCYLLLIDLASRNGRAKDELANVQNVFGFGRSAAQELVASESKNPASADEALDLLMSGVAQSAQLPSLSRRYAMNVLKKRPTCQWAAVMGIVNNPQAKSTQEFLNAVEPKDCPIAKVIEAQILSGQLKFKEACDAMALACKADDTPELMLRHSAYLELTGEVEKAAGLQRKVFNITQDIAAANNLAYLMIASDPTNKARIAEALELVQNAVKQQPLNASFRDTLGYIYHLQGQHEQACMELRKAIMGQPDSAEVHYHLGVAEAACMRVELARWHLAAAVSLGNRLKARNAPMTPQMKQTLDLAQKALSLLGPEK